MSRAARGEKSELLANLVSLELSVPIPETGALVYCYFIKVDANGSLRTHRLIEHICDAVIDYAVPRTSIAAAVDSYKSTGSTTRLAHLAKQAKNAFVEIATTGEGGELLLFVIAERVLGFPQILCKMSLKTSTNVHYHGSDGIHAKLNADDGTLSLYWCESKMHKNSTNAITECFESLAPFIIQPSSEAAVRTQDVLLLGRNVDLNDPAIEAFLKRYFEHDTPESSLIRHCGIALVAFDSEAYPKPPDSPAEDRIREALQIIIPGIREHIKRRIDKEQLSQFEVHVICLPFPSVDDFRKSFLDSIGA